MSTRAATGINTGDPTVPAFLEGFAGPPPWTVDAICAQVDPELFFPGKGGDTGRIAKRICMGCPVREQCLDYALAYESGSLGNPTSYVFTGIYGGLSPRQRMRIVRDRQAAARQLDDQLDRQEPA